MSLTDLRWRLASAVWHPAATLDMWIDRRLPAQPSPEVPECRLLFVVSDEVPVAYRVLRWLIVDPLAWLSDRIFPGWYEDERANLSYWGRDA